MERKNNVDMEINKANNVSFFKIIFIYLYLYFIFIVTLLL